MMGGPGGSMMNNGGMSGAHNGSGSTGSLDTLIRDIDRILNGSNETHRRSSDSVGSNNGTASQARHHRSGTKHFSGSLQSRNDR
jgi:hypothetical protein